jgi:HEAT repeat protein
MADRLNQVLSALLDENQPVPSLDLAGLSDLDSRQANVLASTWHRAPLGQRQAVLKELGQLAQDHIELDFECVNRVALEDADPEVRRQAIANLWECEESGLARILIKLLNSDPHPRVQARAAEALARFVYLGEVNKLDPALLQDIEDALLAHTRPDAEQEIRLRALESLGFSSRAEVPPLIETAYASEDEAERQAGVLAMGRSANERWVDSVVAQLHNPSPKIREEAARAAGELEARAAVAALTELLDDPKDGVRRAAIWSLGLIGGKRAERSLLKLQRAEVYAEDLPLIEDALDYLTFLSSTPEFLIIDMDGPDEDEDEDGAVQPPGL